MRNTRPKVGLSKAGWPLAGFALLFAAAFLILTGCQNPLQRDSRQRTGTLSLTLDSPGLSRATLPGIPDFAWADFDQVNLYFTGGTGDVTRPNWGGEDVDLEVHAAWYLRVEALMFDEEEGDYVPVAKGTAGPFAVTQAGPNSVTVTMVPLPVGEGTLAWNITVPAIVDSAAVRVYAYDEYGQGAYVWSDDDLTIDTVSGIRAVAYSHDLDAGRYFVVFRFETAAGQYVEFSEIVHVYWNLTSTVETEIALGQIPGALLAWIASQWEPVYGFADTPVGYVHFGPLGLGLNGVTAPVIGQFVSLLGSDAEFPTDESDVAVLIDAALVAVGTFGGLLFVFDFSDRYEVEDEIENLIANNTDLDFAWQGNPPMSAEPVVGDVLTVTLGDEAGFYLEVEVTFFSERTQVAYVRMFTTYARDVGAANRNLNIGYTVLFFAEAFDEDDVALPYWRRDLRFEVYPASPHVEIDSATGEVTDALGIAYATGTGSIRAYLPQAAAEGSEPAGNRVNSAAITITVVRPAVGSFDVLFNDAAIDFEDGIALYIGDDAELEIDGIYPLFAIYDGLTKHWEITYGGNTLLAFVVGTDLEDEATGAEVMIRALAEGVAEITVTVGGGHYEIFEVTVSPPEVTSVTISPAGPISLIVGVDRRFEANVVTAPAGFEADFPVSWSSGAAAHVIFVDADGDPIPSDWANNWVYVRSASAGSANVTATAGGRTSAAVVVNVLNTVEHPLLYRHLTRGTSGVAVAGTAAYSDGALTITGQGVLNSANFRGNLVWVGVPIPLADENQMLTAEVDIDLDSIYWGQADANSRIALFVSRYDPGAPAGNVHVYGWLSNIRGSDYPAPLRSHVSSVGAFGGGGNAIGTGSVPATAETLTLGIRPRDGNNQQVDHFWFVDGDRGSGSNQATGTNITLADGHTDHLFVGIFVSNNNANLTTVDITGLRVDFLNDAGLVNVDLRNIIEWTEAMLPDDCDYCGTYPCECQALVDAAAADALLAVNALPVSHGTIAAGIMAAAEGAIDDDIEATWQVAFSLTPAEVATAGSIAGTIRLTLGDHYADVVVNRSIPALGERDRITLPTDHTEIFRMDGVTGLANAGITPTVLANGELLVNPTASWHGIDMVFATLNMDINSNYRVQVRVRNAATDTVHLLVQHSRTGWDPLAEASSLAVGTMATLAFDATAANMATPSSPGDGPEGFRIRGNHVNRPFYVVDILVSRPAPVTDPAILAWQAVMDSDLVRNRGAWTATVDGILFAPRTDNNNGLVLDLDAIRTAAGGFEPTITVTGVAGAGVTRIDVQSGTGGNATPGAEGVFSITFGYAFPNTGPTWATGYTPFLATPAGELGDILITSITVVGGTLIQDMIPGVTGTATWQEVIDSDFIGNRNATLSVGTTPAGIFVSERGTGTNDHNHGLTLYLDGIRAAIGGTAPVSITITGVADSDTGRMDLQTGGASPNVNVASDGSFTLTIGEAVPNSRPSWAEGGVGNPFLGTGGAGQNFDYTVTSIVVAGGDPTDIRNLVP